MKIDLTGLQMPGSPEQPREGQVVLRPLERGFGHTLGTTMRRILLSSLRGSAVWAFRADGVLHEHQTIPGVVEDVHQIIRNLKGLVLELDPAVDRVVLELRTEKAGVVTARQIRENPAVEIIDPDHRLFTLEEDREVRMDLHVNKGRGFVLAEQHDLGEEKLPPDVIRIDAVYNPVRRANFVVEETRVGQRTDFDRLVLEVETNGAIDVPSAVQYAAQVAVEHLTYLAGAKVEWVPGDRQWSNGASSRASRRNALAPRLQETLKTAIEEVNELSVRSRNSLQKENIQTVGELVQKTEAEMLKIDNFGKKSLQEVTEYLAEQGLSLGLRLKHDELRGIWWEPPADEEEHAPAEDVEPGDAPESAVEESA